MSEVHEILRSRRTIHNYAAQPVDAAAIDRALEAAHFAPCHRYTWPWRFTRVGPAGRAVLTELAVRLKSAKGPLPPAKQDRIRAKVGNPAALLVVSQVRCDDPFTAKEDYAATACAIQNLCLSLTADGIGSKWGTGGITRHAETYALCGIDPAAEEIVGFIWIGMPDKPVTAPTRPPLADHVRSIP